MQYIHVYTSALYRYVIHYKLTVIHVRLCAFIPLKDTALVCPFILFREQCTLVILKACQKKLWHPFVKSFFKITKFSVPVFQPMRWFGSYH